MYQRIETKEQLSAVVAKQIKDLIREQRLKPGDKLPNEMELSELFGVSRPTIREAMKSLISQNVVSIRRGRGTFVSETPGIVSDPLGFDFIHSADLQIALIEARLIIEPGAARLAARNAEQKDIEIMERLLKEMEESIQMHHVRITKELEFHRSISRATKNPVIVRIVPVIMEAIQKTYREAPRTPEDHQQALEEHRWVLEAIRSHNPEEAYKAMRHHLENSLQRTLSKKQVPAHL
ncbi:MAG: FadR family transcriptional regulator [Spirochaetes bacterium]|nr:FadR family transcriptional regulator [Spirochaetota bacterium]